MIMDNLEQWRRYTTGLPRFVKAFECLEKLDASQPNGRYEIEGNDIYCLVQRYQTKPLEKAAFEAHKKYADIQFILSGRETMLWAPLNALNNVTQPYTEEKDYGFFATPPEYTSLRVGPGQFAIFFPQDGHAPQILCDQPGDIVKAVVKVRV